MTRTFRRYVTKQHSFSQLPHPKQCTTTLPLPPSTMPPPFLLSLEPTAETVIVIWAPGDFFLCSSLFI